jgi:hypothetical protein
MAAQVNFSDPIKITCRSIAEEKKTNYLELARLKGWAKIGTEVVCKEGSATMHQLTGTYREQDGRHLILSSQLSFASFDLRQYSRGWIFLSPSLQSPCFKADEGFVLVGPSDVYQI